MKAGETLLDAFINANILFCVGFVLWLLLRRLLRSVGQDQAFGTQLKLLNLAFIAILLAPFVAPATRLLQKSGIAPDMKVNLSDMVVSYYLNGGLDMKASEFEGLIQSRDLFILNILNFDGPVAKLLVAAFLIGVAIGLMRLAYSILTLWRIVNQSYEWRSLGRVRIRFSDRTLVPFSTRGLRNYYVVIPSHMLGQGNQVKVSLAHEFQHIRQGDLEWEILLEALKPVFFLNPAFRAWKNQVEHLRELNCDHAVLAKGRVDIRTYCDTLLSVCQKSLRRDRAFVLAVPKVTLVTAERRSGRSFLEQRIGAILETRKLPYQKLVLAAFAIPLIVAVALASVAIQRPADWSHDRLMLSTVVNLDRLDEINRLSAFARVNN